MSTASADMYWAVCDYPGCKSSSRENDDDHGDGSVYDTPELVDAVFDRYEGGFADDYGWIKHEGKYYCCDHVEWDDQTDERRPKTLVGSQSEETP